MAQAHLTNQVIPREMLEQWEREADASTSAPWSACPCSLLLRGRCGPKSWSEYVVAEHAAEHGSSVCFCSKYHAILICIGMPCCTPVYLLHLPFCCCPFPLPERQKSKSCTARLASNWCCSPGQACELCCNPDVPCRWPEHNTAGRSCDAAFEQTLFCGWCCSYCLGHFDCDKWQVSYHDWLHKEDERRHREAYVAERAAEYAERRGT